jgi:hypothetical protein
LSAEQKQAVHEERSPTRQPQGGSKEWFHHWQ